MMYLLLNNQTGSWRTYAGPLEPLLKFGMPDSTVRVLRFHGGCFQVMGYRGDWGDVRNVSLNGGIDGWTANCECMAESQISEAELQALIEGMR